MTTHDVDDNGVGVYVHIPFCERVCPYCDFAVVAAPQLARDEESAYVELLLAELRLRRTDFLGRDLRTIYFGGGTPSLLRPESLEMLLVAIRETFSGDAEEVTLEANPGDVDEARLRAFRALGVDRVSLGAQSFSDAILRRLGRVHDAAAIRSAWRAAERAGFLALSLDLIFATPGQDLVLLERDLLEVGRLGARHVSIYELTIETGTPFATAASRGQLARPDEELVLAMTQCVEATLLEQGLERYEISSYAALGEEASHNHRYWRREPVLGLGVGAWSLDPASHEMPRGRRVGNPRAMKAYRERVENAVRTGGDLAGGAPPLSDAQARGEALFLALRTREGLDARAFAREFGAPPRAFFPEAIDSFLADGLICEETAPRETDPTRFMLTERGRLLADSVFEAFV